jgi:hypothetical protein
MWRTKSELGKVYIYMYLKAEHASQEGKENGHSSNTIEHEGTSA